MWSIGYHLAFQRTGTDAIRRAHVAFEIGLEASP